MLFKSYKCSHSLLLGTVRQHQQTLQPSSPSQLFLTIAVHGYKIIDVFEFPRRKECCFCDSRKNSTFNDTYGCSQTKDQETNIQSHEGQTSFKKAHLQTLKNPANEIHCSSIDCSNGSKDINPQFLVIKNTL